MCQARTEETSLENSTKYSSASMDAIEVVNRLVERQIRAVRGRLEQVLKIEINITDPIVPWVVRHASWLLNRYSQDRRFFPILPHRRKAIRRGSGRAW